MMRPQQILAVAPPPWVAHGKHGRRPMHRLGPAPCTMMALLLLSGALLCAAESAPPPNDERLAAVADPAARELLAQAFDEIARLKQAVSSLQEAHDGSRRLQREGDGQDAREQAREVRIYTRSMQVADPAAQARGRRQAQDGAGGCWTSNADAIDVEGRIAEVNAACCSDPGDDCDSGMPTACDTECASVLLPFWQDCAVHLRAAGNGHRRMQSDVYDQIHRVVKECQEADVSRAGETLAMQLSLSCTDESAVSAECVPACSPELHGDLLLATIDGEDSKYSCELHHGLYSWMGAAADGGYLGRDTLAFVSALLSGAAGAYICTIDEDAAVRTDVSVHPGMHVRVSGDAGLPNAPMWGTGGWEVANSGMLSIAYLQLQGGAIRVAAGGILSLMDLVLDAEQLDWSEKSGSRLSMVRVSVSGINFESGDACGGGSVIRPSSRDLPVIGRGVIDFFGDADYGYNDDCSWTIQCPRVQLEFIEFATEENADYVTLFPDTPNELQLSGVMREDGIGSQRSTTSYTAPADLQETVVHFSSNWRLSSRGFRIEWECPNGPLTTQSYTIAEDSHSLTEATPGALSWQCFSPYDSFRTEAWRLPGTTQRHDAGPYHCDHVSEPVPPAYSGDFEDDIFTDDPPIFGRWVRLAGEGGDALHTQPVGEYECGSEGGFWLSGWNPADGTPPYSTPAPPGTLPTSADGIKPMTRCLGEHVCHHPKTVHALSCGSFFLWRLPEYNLPCPLSYCTSPSGIQDPDMKHPPGAENPNAIATQGTDCVGHYEECTALCEVQEDRPWVEVVPRTGYGLSCDAAIAQHPGDCSPGDGGCGNTDACSLSGVLVDTVSGAGTIGFSYDTLQPCTDVPGWGFARALFHRDIGCQEFEAQTLQCCGVPTGGCDHYGTWDTGNGPANDACCACGGGTWDRHPCAWYIECPGLESPRLTFTPGNLPPGHTVTVHDGIDSVGGHTAPLLASLSGNVTQQEWQATGRSITVAFTRHGEVEVGDGFSASWFCH